MKANPAVLLLIFLFCAPLTAAYAQKPRDFIDLRSVAPDIVLDIRYATADNFIGRPIPGYEAPKCLLTRSTADALKRVQHELREVGLSLKVYDCYRPQTAVDYFVAWAADLDDQSEKMTFYPSVDKEDLLRNGYIAENSGHSRGSTVDLTVAPARAEQRSDDLQPSDRSCESGVDNEATGETLDMGTAYDCFSELSHTGNLSIEPQQRANRLLLKKVMESNGFENLPEEWWHYTLSDERYPDTYFRFPVN